MIVPDNTKQALTIKRVKYQKSESSQPRIAACKGCGGGGSGFIRDNARPDAAARKCVYARPSERNERWRESLSASTLSVK